MLRFVADENFNNAIVRGLFRLNPALDLITVQDVKLERTPDPDLLEWAASQRRLLLTHDIKTIPNYVKARVMAGLSMPGVIEVPAICPIARVIDEILFLHECSDDGDWARSDHSNSDVGPADAIGGFLDTSILPTSPQNRTFTSLSSSVG